MTYGQHWKSEAYGRECYVSYTKSVCLAMERRLMDLTPRRSAIFWRWFDEEIAIAKHRMKMVSGQISQLGSVEE